MRQNKASINTIGKAIPWIGKNHESNVNVVDKNGIWFRDNSEP